MNRLGKYRSKISDRASGSLALPSSSPSTEARSGYLVRCVCGHLSWDTVYDRCLFAHRATTRHAKATRQTEQDWENSWVEWLKAVGA